MTVVKKQNNAEMLKEDKERTSLYLNKGIQKSIKYISFMSERRQTDVIAEALTDYINKWVKKHGEIPK